MHQLLLRHVAQSCPHPQTINRSLQFEKNVLLYHAFDKMHVLMAANALAAYPDHNKWFDIYTDASDIQLCACIVQENRLVAYFSHKL